MGFVPPELTKSRDMWFPKRKEAIVSRNRGLDTGQATAKSVHHVLGGELTINRRKY